MNATALNTEPHTGHDRKAFAPMLAGEESAGSAAHAGGSEQVSPAIDAVTGLVPYHELTSCVLVISVLTNKAAPQEGETAESEPKVE